MILKIDSKDIIVEIDESKFGKRKYNKGHKVEGSRYLAWSKEQPRKK
ncbi:hypothetical protein ENBRE01_2680 [Enteropsectra breve]|nr:hypothetical protein ENBRE01_2680 [Enteropsectra breve]